MARVRIPVGSKLTLYYESGGVETFEMKSTFEKSVSDVSFLISAPIRNNSYIDIDCFRQILVKYKLGDITQMIPVYPEERVTVGKRVFWRVRQVGAAREFIPRIDKRYSVFFPASYASVSWDPDNPLSGERLPAQTMDLSAGGVALFMASDPKVGEVMNVIFPQSGSVKAVMQKAEVCWIREAKKGSPYRNMSGLKFLFSTEQEKTDMIKYINMAIVKYSG